MSVSEVDICNTKVCSVCKVEKPLVDYYERTNHCKPCHHKATKARYRQNRAQMIEYHRDYNSRPTNVRRRRDQFLQKAYRITLEEYNELFANQNGCCAICGTHQSELNRALAVDHDHKTKNVRGLLCQSCNQAMGLLFDDQILLKKMIRYLGENDVSK